jgi:hypothetical protein
MLPSLLLAASTTVLSLDRGDVHLAVPVGVRVRQSRVNWETDSYELYEANEKGPFLSIFVGGGAWDLHRYTPFLPKWPEGLENRERRFRNGGCG